MGEKYVTLDEVCQMLSISKATGRNWLRLGKIESQRDMTDGKVYFTEDYVIELQRSLKTGKRNALRSRRNKGYVSGKGFYDRYVSEDCESTDVVKKLAGMLAEQNICVTETAMRALLSDCALKLLVDIPETNEILREYIDGRLDVGVWSILLDDIIQDKKEIETWISEHNDLLDISYKFQKGEDVLGLLYMSVRDIGVRKAAGSYFTPTEIVRNMIMDISQDLEDGLKGKKVLDPCCGTGNFLIQLSDDVDICNIHAFDTDMLSVQLARFNLALTRIAGRENVKAESDIRTICENVECRDFLAKSEDRISNTVNYDVIIGNPPWGYKFDSAAQKALRENYKTAAGRGAESYDIFVERALGLLGDDGMLAFVLPEAVLDVRNHSAARQIIADTTNVRRVRFLDNVFHGVQCPAVAMHLKKSADPGHSIGARISRAGEEFVIGTDRPLDIDRFLLRLNDDEYRLLDKLDKVTDCIFLRGQADFALGIVTGDNDRYLSEEWADGMEGVITGADVYRYRYGEPERFIASDISLYQQAAPERIYRAPEKLIYRFINRQLVFAYDDRRHLTLNSCNVVIPRVAGLDMKYIMAVLNSRVAQYIYEKRYNAVKVLRSHIESLPIPETDENTQRDIISKVDELILAGTSMHGTDQIEQHRVYDEIDDIVRNLYSVTDEEYEFIKQTLSGSKYML